AARGGRRRRGGAARPLARLRTGCRSPTPELGSPVGSPVDRFFGPLPVRLGQAPGQRALLNDPPAAPGHPRLVPVVAPDRVLAALAPPGVGAFDGRIGFAA